MEENMNMQDNNCKTCCSCPHHNMMSWMVILFALVFLAGYFGILSESTVGLLWPIIVLLTGISKLMGRSCKCCSRCCK